MARFFIENYGCQMNSAEADSLRQLLVNHGHIEAKTPAESDVAILNTCSVRQTAEQRIEGRLGFYRGINQKYGKKLKVVIMGCMARNSGKSLREKFPDVVTILWGTYHKHKIANILDRLDGESDFLEMQNYSFMPAYSQYKYPFKAFVPISHGCSNFCTYCIVPYVRGPEVHRPISDILDNVRRLVDSGVKEICLLGQNVNSYIFSGINFPEMLNKVANISDLPRVTFLTSHPKDFSRELVEVMKSHSNIMTTLHLPFQSGSDRILELMKRKYTVSDYLEKVKMAKEIPGITLTTDIMVGFPGESEADFEATLRMVEEVGFYEAYMYRFNIRPGTPAAKLPNQVSESVKLKRLDQLIRRQAEIARHLRERHIGEQHTVLLEAQSKRNPTILAGRTHNGLMCYLEGGAELIGQVVEVQVTGVSGNGLVGRVVNS